MQARKLLERVQALERQKQTLQFQQQQFALGLQQAQAAHAMEKQFQEALKIQQQVAPLPPPGVSRPTVKLALRKRYRLHLMTILMCTLLHYQDKHSPRTLSFAMLDNKLYQLVMTYISIPRSRAHTDSLVSLAQPSGDLMTFHASSTREF